MSSAAKPSGPALIGAASVWPYSHLRLTAGRVVSVGTDLKVGVVRVHDDGAASVKLFGGSGPTFFEEYATLRPGEGVDYRHHRVQLVESRPDGDPRAWIRLVCR